MNSHKDFIPTCKIKLLKHIIGMGSIEDNQIGCTTFILCPKDFFFDSYLYILVEDNVFLFNIKRNLIQRIKSNDKWKKKNQEKMIR